MSDISSEEEVDRQPTPLHRRKTIGAWVAISLVMSFVILGTYAPSALAAIFNGS